MGIKKSVIRKNHSRRSFIIRPGLSCIITKMYDFFKYFIRVDSASFKLIHIALFPANTTHLVWDVGPASNQFWVNVSNVLVTEGFFTLITCSKLFLLRPKVLSMVLCTIKNLFLLRPKVLSMVLCTIKNLFLLRPKVLSMVLCTIKNLFLLRPKVLSMVLCTIKNLFLLRPKVLSMVLCTIKNLFF